MKSKTDIILALILSLFVISFAVTFTLFFKPLYYFDINYLNIAQDSGIDEEIIKENYDILINHQSVFATGELSFPDFAMSETGRIHFEEVKNIFVAVQILLPITGLIALLWGRKRFRDKNYRFLLFSPIFTIGIPGIIGLIAAINFNKVFTIFHKIFFRNDYWIFDYRTDPIITILPEAFFMHCFFLIVAIMILLSIGMIALYIFKRKNQSK